MKGRLLYIFAAIIVSAGSAAAQNKLAQKDSVIKGTTIEILQSYKPELKQTPRPELIPQLPPVDTARPVFIYRVPQQLLYYRYSSQALRPLALGKDTVRLPFENYVQIGAGNRSTIYFDAGIGSVKGENYETALHATHISQQGDIKYQQTALTGFEADGTLHKYEHTWHVSLAAKRNQYGYYGGNGDSSYHYNTDSQKQVFTGFRVVAGTQNEQPVFANVNYHPTVSASVYTDRFSASETSLGFDLPVSYTVDSSLELSVALRADFSQFNTVVRHTGNNLFQLVPRADYHNNVFSIYGSFAPAFGSGGNFYLLPDIGASYLLPESIFTISAGWQSLIKRNTFEQLSTFNPYIINNYQTRQTHSDEVYGSVQGSWGKHLSFSGRLSWWQYSNMPLFINNYSDQKQFYVVYADQLNATSIQAAAKYQVTNSFSATVNATFYKYFNYSTGHVWNMPTATFRGALLFQPFSSLVVTAYIETFDGIYALSTSNASVRLDPGVDIGGYAEYMVIPRLSFFARISNLLNDNYQRWQGYPVYGLNVYGGVRLKF